jgi:hypothetical protein
MGEIGEKLSAAVAGIIALAVIAIVISQRANTTNVLAAFFGGVSNLIGVAISPITGQSVSGLTAGGSSTGLTGGGWQTGGFAIGSNGSIGVTGSNGTSISANGIGNLIGQVGNMFGGSSSTGSGVIDAGSFGGDYTAGAATGGAIDAGAWDSMAVGAALV